MHGPEVIFLVIGIVGVLFIGLPWLIFHYVTKWKSQATITTEDENLLDELHDLARRLDDRMATIERIIAVEDPSFRRPETERLRDDRQDDHVFDQLSERRPRERRR